MLTCKSKLVYGKSIHICKKKPIYATLKTKPDYVCESKLVDYTFYKQTSLFYFVKV